MPVWMVTVSKRSTEIFFRNNVIHIVYVFNILYKKYCVVQYLRLYKEGDSCFHFDLVIMYLNASTSMLLHIFMKNFNLKWYIPAITAYGIQPYLWGSLLSKCIPGIFISNVLVIIMYMHWCRITLLYLLYNFNNFHICISLKFS